MREHAAWKVDTHMRRPTGPTSSATRSRISPAALLVKVIASTSNGDAPSSATRYASRCVSTRVLPEPAPATTRIGPGGSVTASYCAGLSPDRSSSRRGRGGSCRRVDVRHTTLIVPGRITRVSGATRHRARTSLAAWPNHSMRPARSSTTSTGRSAVTSRRSTTRSTRSRRPAPKTTSTACSTTSRRP